MQAFNIYLCGVGGQGIGLLSEILLRAADYAGYCAKAVDTHGLAQRGVGFPFLAGVELQLGRSRAVLMLVRLRCGGRRQ